jgi:type II secretory pathway pseudopilin PulG
MNSISSSRQHGLTLVGLIFVLAILGVIGVLGLKVVPTVVEYYSIKKAVASAKTAGTTIHDIQAAFDRQTDVGYIDAISGKDLQIVKDGDQFEVSFAYPKKIPLFGPASLLIEYAGSTAKKTVQ